MDAPQLPDAEASPARTGAQPPGQFSAFRRALDAQADPPSAGGPTVVMPVVSAPGRPGRVVIGREDARDTFPASATDDTAAHYQNTAIYPATDAASAPTSDLPIDSNRSSRLPTTVAVSILLGVIAGTALVLINLGHSGEPLAPTTMPVKPPVALSTPPQAAQPTATHKASQAATTARQDTPAASHTATNPSPNPPAGQGATGNNLGAGTGAGTASFATITWTNSSEPIVVDMQARLAKLGYLRLSPDGSQYSITRRTLDEVQWQPVPDNVGFYQNSTDSGIRAFEFDYLQHGQGSMPLAGQGCSSQTYRALVQATT